MTFKDHLVAIICADVRGLPTYELKDMMRAAGFWLVDARIWPVLRELEEEEVITRDWMPLHTAWHSVMRRYTVWFRKYDHRHPH